MTKVAKHKPMIVRGRRTNYRLVPAPVWNFQSKSSSRHKKGSCRLFFMYAEAFNRDEVDRWAHEEAERRSDADGDKGTWWIEFSLRGEYIHQSVPGARTLAHAQRAENQLREAIYNRKYDPGKKIFDENFLPWSKANSRSHREDAQRSVTLKNFFGEKHLRDIKPMMIENFKRERLATPTKHDRRIGPGRGLRPASTAISLVSQRSSQWLLIMN